MVFFAERVRNKSMEKKKFGIHLRFEPKTFLPRPVNQMLTDINFVDFAKDISSSSETYVMFLVTGTLENVQAGDKLFNSMKVVAG